MSDAFPRTTKIAKGSFSVEMAGEPPFDERGGVSLSRATIDKTFRGPLDARSTVHMLAARTAQPTSAGYVALERIEGHLEGRLGSFVVVHLGLMGRGHDELRVEIVPDSGTGELTGIRGSMSIVNADGQHDYIMEYELGG